MSSKNPHKMTAREPSAHDREEVSKDPLLSRLAQSDPLRGQDLTSWAESSEGQETFSRVLARKREGAVDLVPTTPHRRFIGRPRMWFALSGATVLVAVLVVAIVLSTQGHIQQVAISPTSTTAASTATTAAASITKQLPSIGSPSTTSGTRLIPKTPATVAGTPSAGGTSSGAGSSPHVDQPPPAVTTVAAAQALSRIVVLAEKSQNRYQPATPSVTDIPANKVADRALAVGVLIPSEVPGLLLGEPVTRGEFALWLWRTFGSKLPSGQASGIRDLNSVSGAQRQAVAGLVGAGVFPTRDDGYFRAAIPLTPEDEAFTLSRIATILKLGASETTEAGA
jgi:hypothetical protein